MKKEVFEKLIELAASCGSDVVFMPMQSHAKGLITQKPREYKAEDLEGLMHIAEDQGISVRFVPFGYYDGRIKGKNGDVRIGIRIGMSFDDYVYTLAHELAHYFLHYDKGDTIGSSMHDDYEEQADRAAKMLLAALSV